MVLFPIRNHPPIHPPTRHLSLECFDLSIYWPDLDQTLNKGSWQYILQINHNCHHDICPGYICPGDICPYQQYLSYYWPDLDLTLNKESWEHIQQITTVNTTFVQATFVFGTFDLGTFVHINNISAVTGPI